MALNLDAIGQKIGPLTKDYDWKELVTYALGVGAGFDDLDYVYEGRLKVIPSFSIASIFDFLAETAVKANVDLSGILHGEQDIIFHNPIPTQGTLTTEGRVTNMYDKGADKGALVVSEADTYHSDGQKLYTNIFTLFCRKDGGFGGEPGGSDKVEMPEREPDLVEEALPSPNQPLLYRLSGDIFTLHVDPEFAKAAGYDKPIMHGLCTHGYACRAVINQLFPGEPERMTRFRVRFSRTLYPGVPIKTEIWRVDDGVAHFRTINAETGEVVLDGGIVEWISAEEAAARSRRGTIDFDGRVALVTGAGAGLGRSYALELARRGAAVVVNDLGGATDGTGESTNAADAVVTEILEAGGKAVANYDNVATEQGGKAMVDQAVEAFGRIDIVINNAGILRDRTLAKMTPDWWRAVMAVHLDGAYFVTRPALDKMRKQGYGRVVFTTSAAGLHGNFGQANYSAAKMGIVGLMNSLKLEGEPMGVKVNTVAPIAGTRLTEGVIPPDLFEKLQPEFVTPLVVYLASEQCPVNGHVYNAGGGYFNRAAMVDGPGIEVGDGMQPPTAEAVAAAMEEIKVLEGGADFRDAAGALSPMLDSFGLQAKKAAEAKSGGGELTLDGVFNNMAGAFNADAASEVEVVFQFDIGEGQYYAAIADGACQVGEGPHDKPTTTVIMSEPDFLALIKGELNPMTAYTGGKLKIKGDLMKSQLLDKVFDFAALAAGGGGAEEAPVDQPASSGVAGVFARMPSAFQPEAAAGVDVVFQYDISGPDGGQWHSIIKDQACMVHEEAHDKPTTTISMSDADFLALMAGELNPMAAFTSGKLKIKGDLMKSQLIDKLFKF